MVDDGAVAFIFLCRGAYCKCFCRHGEGCTLDFLLVLMVFLFMKSVVVVTENPSNHIDMLS